MRKLNISMAVIGIAVFFFSLPIALATTPTEYRALPVIGATAEPPLVMLIMDRNHKLYYEAYNDASDLNEDGVLDVGYNPAIDYYGYFDSYKIYVYDSGDKRFEPVRDCPAGQKGDATGAGEWSGDFLNYLTMSRMDAIRKVLYGGYRSTDTATETVLERAYIPQDAHSWGKEYQSIERDKYDIRAYTPLDLPSGNTYHLFASTSLADASNAAYNPLLRVLPNNAHRIWEWVAKERPVADSSLVTAGGFYNQHPANHEGFNTMVAMFANDPHKQGSSAATQINGSGNPHAGDDNYMTIFNGTLNITTEGDYQFSVDGDDAVEVMIDGVVVAGWYGGHGACGSGITCRTDPLFPFRTETVNLAEGAHTVVFRHEELSGGDSYYLYWNGPDSGSAWQIVPPGKFTDLTQTNYSLAISASTITDYVVRVQVGVSEALREANCKRYPNGSYKPIGLLQRYGETNRMKFGLMTGSYTKNTAGGVLRKKIGSFSSEVDGGTGQFTDENDIVRTINKLRIVDFRYGPDYDYNSDCGWIASRPINAGECRMWGNPVGEMMYETLRYFAGKGSPTAAFTYDDTATHDDNELGLPKPDWDDPYDTNPFCAKPFMLVISDINPTFDSDQLPGSPFPGAIAGDLPAGMNVKTLADLIGMAEGDTGAHFIGQSGATYDGACTVKDITGGLGHIRGLCPEEPTKQGSYYSAAAAYYGHINDINSVEGNQFIDTFAVGLASPLPRIEIPIGGNFITLVPFAKSVGGYSISAAQGSFQPTNTIVDFFIETLTPTSGRFRINYEDVEQGADHDMDAIITYTYQLVDGNNNPVDDPLLGVKVKITLSSDFAAGSIKQHCGYIISGTTQDGTYLEVRDVPENASDVDVDYFLDTPPGVNPGGDWDDDIALPLSTFRLFSPNPVGGATPAKLLKNPLWYAGKWGGFEDQNDNDLPDEVSEWDKDAVGTPGHGTPDNYFYVTNPLKLEEQLGKSFADISAKSASGTSASVVSTTKEGEATLVQAYFRPVTSTATDEIRWTGYLQSLWIDAKGFFREDTDGDHALDVTKDRVIVYGVVDGETKVRRFNVSPETPFPDITADEGYFTIALEDILPIWEAGRVLKETDPSDRNIFTTVTGDTFVDFSVANADVIKPFLGVKPADITAFPDANIDLLGADEATRATTLINYIRGTDKAGLRNRTVDGKVWKLGDIVYSTPVSISKPVESYHVLYSDKSYSDFFRLQKDRQTMVYVGANDGMLHAFTSWKYDDADGTFKDSNDYLLNQGQTIGDELWAFVPKAVLPHLKWLSDPEYAHTYYVDLTPKVFDARIAGGAGAPQWGTFMLVGLNMGGKNISLDTNGDAVLETFTPSYSLIDITDPTTPKLMWERSYVGLGMSRSEPIIMKIGGPIRGVDGLESSGRTEKWLAVLGSGPTDYDGTSNQQGRIYIVDLKTGAPLGAGGNDYLFSASNNAAVTSIVALDRGLDYEVDAIYFGETIKSDPGDPDSPWIGKVWSIDTYLSKGGSDPSDWVVSENPADWHPHFLLEEYTYNDAGDKRKLGPLSAPMAISSDSFENVWIYFGTGRYIFQSDKADANPQALFGLKDPLFSKDRNYTLPDYTGTQSQAIATLLNSSRYRVVAPRKVQKANEAIPPTWTDMVPGDWEDLLNLVRKVDDEDTIFTDGWVRSLDFCTTPSCPAERCISKFAIFSGGVFVPTFVPNQEVCMFGGTSYLYGLYYETGTNYYKPIAGDTLEPKKDLGETTPPPKMPIHVDAKGNARLAAQLGSGAVVVKEIEDALSIASGISNWID